MWQLIDVGDGSFGHAAELRDCLLVGSIPE
jgi:hypothetical protein